MFLKQIFTAALFLFVLNVSAQKYTNTEALNVTKKYNGDSFTSTNTFSENMSNSSSFSILSEILKNDQMRSIIEAEEMVTVFIPLDSVFVTLTDEEREVFMADTVLQSQLLKMHTIPGRIDSASLKKAIEENGGRAQLKTLAETKLTVVMTKDGKIFINDDEGNKAQVVDTDFYHKNGFFHIIEGVASPLKNEK